MRSARAHATAAWGGFREGELRGLQWEDYKLATDDFLGMLSVTRSVWRSHIGRPKTKKSQAPVPVIPQLANRLAGWRQLCGSPATGHIFPNGAGRPLNLDWLYQNKMKDVLINAGIKWKGWHGFRRGLASCGSSKLNLRRTDDSVLSARVRQVAVLLYP